MEIRTALDRATIQRFSQRLEMLSDIDESMKKNGNGTTAETYRDNMDSNNVVIKVAEDTILSQRKERRRRTRMRSRNDVGSIRYNQCFRDQGGLLNVQVHKRWGVEGALLKFIIAFNKRDIRLFDIIEGFKVHDITIIGKIVVDKSQHQVRIPINISFEYQMEDPHQRGQRNSDLLFQIPIQKPRDFYGTPLKQLLFSLPITGEIDAERSTFCSDKIRWKYGITLENKDHRIWLKFSILITGNGYGGRTEKRHSFHTTPLEILQVTSNKKSNWSANDAK